MSHACYSLHFIESVLTPHSSMSALEGAVEFPHTQGCLYNYVMCILSVYVPK